MQIKGATALITGGASGLGEATATRLLAQGANVVIADLNAQRGAALVESWGERAAFASCDVTRSDDIAAAIELAVNRFGRLDVLVNCAGRAAWRRVVSREGPHDIGYFQKIIAINLTGTFDAIRLAAHRMAGNQPSEEGERGVIVNTASAAAVEPLIGQAAYAAAKGGVASLTLAVARDLGNLGIRVCSISPGVFETPMMVGADEEETKGLISQTPFPRRLGKPHEYALLVQHIVENTMLNGEIIRLDGALRMSVRY